VPVRVIFHMLWVATALRVLVPSFADPDLWGHVLFGSILLGGELPAVNGFSYTAADHAWVNHEVLAEISMAAIYNAGGAGGLIAFKVGLGLATLFLVWRAAFHRTHDHVASGIATTVVALVMTPGFMIRPQIFTLLFLAATLAELAKVDYRPRGMAWGLPLLFVVWINTHGGVLAGLGLAGIGVIAALAGRWRGGERRLRDVATSGLFLATLALALLVNPWGVGLLDFLATDVTPQVAITEWAPVSLTDASFPVFKLVLTLVAAYCLLGTNVRLPEAIIAIAAGTVAIMHQRHIPLFAIAATPIVAAAVAEWWQARARPSVRRLAVGACAMLAVAQLGIAMSAGIAARGQIFVNPWHYPVQAVRFLVQNDIAGNVALPFHWGEYAIWSLPPGSRVAVDGRFTTAYPQNLLSSVWHFMSGEPEWETLLTDYPTDIVISDRNHAPATLLRDHEEWEYVYSDPVSVVFIRHIDSQAETIARFRDGSLRYDNSPLDTSFPGAFQGNTGTDIPFLPSADCRRAADGAPSAPRPDFC